MAIMMSIPLAFFSLYSVLVWGLASEMAAAMIQRIRVVNLSDPAISLGLVPSEAMIESDEKVMLAGVPNLPLRMNSRGMVRRRSSHQGCARLRL